MLCQDTGIKKSKSLLANSLSGNCKAPFFTYNLSGKDVRLSYYHYSPYNFHWHGSSQHLLKIFLSDGEISYLSKGIKQYRAIHKGDVVIIPANVNYRADWKQEIEFVLVAVNLELIDRLARNVCPTRSANFTLNFIDTDILLYGIGSVLLKEYQKERSDSSYIGVLLQTLIGHLQKKHFCSDKTIDANSARYREPRLEQAIEYINNNLDRYLSLEEIAEEIKIGKYYFCRLFKKHLGISPYQYILQRRIDRAMMLIQHDPNMKMVDIALSCGFSSQSHFNKQFRSLTGNTPGIYRQTYCS